MPCQNPLFRCVNAAWKGDQRKPKFEGDPKRWLSSEEAAKLNQEFFSQGTFATCSSDSTVRFWNLDPSKGAPDSAEFPGADPTDREGVACLYLQEEEPGNSNEGNSGASVSVRAMVPTYYLAWVHCAFTGELTRFVGAEAGGARSAL